MSEPTTVLDGLRAAVAARRAPDQPTLNALRTARDPALLRRAGRLLTALEPAAGELAPVRVAILATCTVGAYPALLRAALVGAGALPALSTADYGTFDLTLASAGFTATPTATAGDGEGTGDGEGGGDGEGVGGGGGDGERGVDVDVVTVLVDAGYFLRTDWDPTDLDAVADHLDARLAHLRQLLAVGLAQTSATVVLHTVPLPGEALDSIVSWHERGRFTRLWYRLNMSLLELAEEYPQIVVVDLVGLLADAEVGARDARLHRYADLPYTDGALLLLARQVRRVAQARLGLSRKVLALDLDNTLWGGVIGEVGAAGVQAGGLYPGNCYQDLQRTVRRLCQQGVIPVLVSKNDPGPVTEALVNHPDLLVRPDTFAAAEVGWEPKPAGLRRIADTLALATRSFVFMDDSPFERAEMTATLPEVAVVAADGDPAHLTGNLLGDGWFDVMTLTETDRRRPHLYRSRARRHDYAAAFTSREDFLQALDIEVRAAPVTPFTLARTAQLAARTNQFNLSGVRFDEATTAAMLTDPGHLVYSFAVADRFGDEGLVGAAWIRRDERRWRVLNLVLSCRVLSRGIEFAIVDWLVGRARAAGVPEIVGGFVATGRNGVAAGFWEKAGFAPVADTELSCPRARRRRPSPPGSPCTQNRRSEMTEAARPTTAVDRATIEESVLAIVGDVLDRPVAALRAEPDLATNGWDSLAALDALAQIESAWGIRLDLRPYHAVHEVGELVELICVTLAGGAAS